MNFSNLRSATAMAIVAALACAWSYETLPAFAQEQDQQQTPAEGDQAAPPADQAAPEQAAPADSGTDASQPAAEPSQDGTATEPSAEPAPETTAPSDEATTPPADNGGAADVAPAAPEQPAAEAPAAPAEGTAAISASDVQIGAAVFGSDGAKIGEVNGVKSDDNGKVQEILVTDGVPAGINAKVFEVPADKIASVSDGVKLSLSSEEAKQLPVIDNSNG